MSLVFPQVLNTCGRPTYIDAEASKTSQYAKSVSPNPYVEVRIFAKMEDVKMTVYTLSPFFQELPLELCVGDDLAAKQTHVDNCWNGTSKAK